MAKKMYRVPIYWTMCGVVCVEAENEEEAIEFALGPNCLLPKGEYLEGSVDIDGDSVIENGGMLID